MGFYIFILCMSLLIPCMMLGFAIMFKIKPPKHINDFYGYRTRRAKINQETWDFAHKFMARIWYRVSIIIFTLSLIPFIFIYNESRDITGITGLILVIVQSVVLILSTIPVEFALKRTFDKDGKRK